MKEGVIVIGAGIGGLSCAALLAHGGYKVSVLEKNPYLGGACSSYIKNGYTFDRGVHLFTSGLNGPFGTLFNKLGLNYLKFIKHINKKTAMKVYQKDGDFPFDINIDSLLKVLELLNSMEESDNAGGGLSGLEDMGFSGTTINDFSKVLKNLMTMDKVKLDRLYEDGLTVTHWLKQFTEDRFIHGIFAFLLAGMFAIGSSKASAAEFIKCFKDEMISEEGYQYPAEGASQAIPNAIAKAIKHYGGEVCKDTFVERIVIEDNRVKGVIVNNKMIIAPMVISNLSIKWTVVNLVGRQYFDKGYLLKIEGLLPSLSAITFKIALKKPIIDKWEFVNCYHPTLHDWGDKYGRNAPLSNGFFGPVLSNIDPNLAPPGHQAVIFSTLTPAKCPDWKRWRDIYWDDLQSFFPDLEEKLDFVDVSYPDDIAVITGKAYGPVEGLGLIPAQTGKNKPSSVVPGIEGLFVVGDTTGKNSHGIGTQLACYSGINCAEAILGNIDISMI